MVPVKRPVKLAEVIEVVCWVRTKSSPVSVSAVPGRDVVAILPSGSPVLKIRIGRRR
jgi:hypothetical protein